MPTFDAGKIEGTLTLDRSPFNRELKKAQADAKKFEKDPIKKKVELDTKTFDKVLKEVQAKSKKIGAEKPTISIDGDADDFEREFKKVIADTDALQTKSAEVSIQADADTALASAKIANLENQVRRLDGEDIDIDVKVDGAGTAVAGVNLLRTSLLGLVPAAIPAIAAITAGTMGLVAGLSAATGAVSIFGLAMGGSVISAAKANSELSELREKLDETTDAAQRATILEQITKITDDMSTSVRAFSDELDTTKDAWKEFVEASSPATLFQAGRALQIFQDALVPLPGVVNALAPAFNSWLDGIDDWVSGPGYQGFLGFVMEEGPQALQNLGQIMGNLVSTIGNLVQAFTPFGQDFLGTIANMTERWQELSRNMEGTTGFRDFMEYMQQTGPQLVDALTAIGRAVIDVGVALAPLGGPTLEAVRSFAEVISAVAESAPGLVQAGVMLFAFSRIALALGDTVSRTRVQLDNFNRMLGSTGKASTRLGSAMKGAVGFVGGPWGIAITAASALLLGFANQHANAEQRTRDLQSSLDQQTGAITKNTTAKLQATVADQGLMAVTTGLGLSMETVVAAASGNKAALAEVKGATDAASTALKQGSSHFSEYGLSAEQARLDIGDLLAFIKASNGDINAQRDAIFKAKDAFGQYQAAGSEMTFATREGAEAHAEAGRKIRGQISALEGLISAMQAARMESLRIKNAQINYEQSLDDTNRAIKENGKNHDISTQKGRDNWRALLAQAEAQNAYVDDVKFTSRSMKEQIAILKEQRAAFIEDAVAMGFTKERARELADQYLKTPREVKTKAKLEAQKKELEQWKKGLKDLSELSPETRAKILKDMKGLGSWVKELFGLEKIKPETDTKLNKDTENKTLWDRMLEGISNKEETDTKLNKDTGGVSSWKGLIDGIQDRHNTDLKTQANTGGIYAFKNALASIPRSVTTVLNSVRRVLGFDGGIVTDGGIIPGYADGGAVDLTRGGRIPGYGLIDDQLAMLRRGEEVAIPETGRWLREMGLDIPGLNDLARRGKLPDGTGGGGDHMSAPSGRGSKIEIQNLNIQNPAGKTSKQSMYDTIEELNVLYS